MLTHSTVSICRRLLAKELAELDHKIYQNGRQKVLWSVYPPNWIDTLSRNIFLRICNQEKRLKTRKVKIENSIRELKAWSWTGNPKELPCEK
jgi:hypothetical protein